MHSYESRYLALLLACWLLGSGAATTNANPPRLAEFVQVNIQGSSGVGAITNGAIVRGNGWFDRMTWLPSAEQPRSYFAGIDISRLLYLRLCFEFTPQSNGTVSIGFTGPWVESSPGIRWRQDVAVDDAQVTGASLANGGFESAGAGNAPSNWTWSPGPHDITQTNPPPHEGTNAIIVWADNGAYQNLAVTGGIPVRLWLQARARTPTNFADQPRLPSSNTLAHTAALRFARGVNLANYLEAPPHENWGGSYSNDDLVAIARQGFDHVRIPCAWHYHTGPAPAYAISNAFFQKVDKLVTNALAKGLGVIVNVHHFDDFTTSPSAWTNKLFALWTQIAARYSNQNDRLVFEILNEPKDAATTAVMNPVYARAIEVIRAVSPNRTILIGPGLWNSIDELENLQLPSTDSNIIVTVHDYEPFLFTHQGATWTLPATYTTNVVYPGPPPAPVAVHPASAGIGYVSNWFIRYNTAEPELNPCGPEAWRDRLRLARAWSDYYGRPVHVGEWGCYETADAASRLGFHTDKREDLDAHRLGWALWDWSAGFHYWDRSQQSPVTGMKDALLPDPQFTQISPAQLQGSGSFGRRYALEMSSSLSGGHWTPLSTQTLMNATSIWDMVTPGTTGAFRVEWLLP